MSYRCPIGDLLVSDLEQLQDEVKQTMEQQKQTWSRCSCSCLHLLRRWINIWVCCWWYLLKEWGVGKGPKYVPISSLQNIPKRFGLNALLLDFVEQNEMDKFYVPSVKFIWWCTFLWKGIAIVHLCIGCNLLSDKHKYFSNPGLNYVVAGFNFFWRSCLFLRKFL